MATKTTTKKTAASKAPPSGEGQRGRVARTAGKRIDILKTQEEARVRGEGKTAAYWKLMRKGMKVEDFRAKAVEAGYDSGNANAQLRIWEAKGFIRLVDSMKS